MITFSRAGVCARRVIKELSTFWNDVINSNLNYKAHAFNKIIITLNNIHVIIELNLLHADQFLNSKRR